MPPEQALHLYHYTDEGAFDAISRSQFLRPAAGAFGVGHYFTDLPPTGVFEAAGYSRSTFLLPTLVEKVTHFFCIDVSRLNAPRVAGVYTDDLFSIYLNQTEFGLAIQDILVSSGRTVFRT